MTTVRLPKPTAVEVFEPPAALGVIVGRRVRQYWRLGVAAGALASLFMFALLIAWAQHRYLYVVTRDAMVTTAVSKVGARFDGKVARLSVAPGQLVARGDLIAELANEHLRARVESAEAEMDEARCELHVARLDVDQERHERQDELRLAGTRVDMVQAELDAALSERARREDEYARLIELRERGAASDLEFDRAGTALEVEQAHVRQLRATLEQSRERVALARTELDGVAVKHARLEVLEAHVHTAQARLEKARADLEATFIRAFEDARVIECLAGPGASVRVGQPVIAVQPLGAKWVDAWVAQRSISDLALGSAAEVTIDGMTHEPLSGKVVMIGGLAPDDVMQRRLAGRFSWRAGREGAVHVRISLDRQPDWLCAGMSATVSIARRDHR